MAYTEDVTPIISTKLSLIKAINFWNKEKIKIEVQTNESKTKQMQLENEN